MGHRAPCFGKNTTGGLINITRGAVTMEWGGDFAIVTLDEHGREDVKGVVNVPLVDDRFGREAVRGSDQESDGFVVQHHAESKTLACVDDRPNLRLCRMKWQPS